MAKNMPENSENMLPDYLEEADGFVTIKLLREIEVDGAKTKVVQMREPTVADQLRIEKMKGSDAEKEVNMIADLCQLAPDDIKKIGLRDYKRISSGLGIFLD